MTGDATLLSAWRAGDAGAGTTLFDRHFDVVRRFFHQKVYEDDIVDLIQETFLACVENAGGFRGDATFRAYLLGIARHKLRDYWRARGRSIHVDLDTVALVDLDPSPSSVLRRQSSRRMLLEALHAIPLDHQILLELCYWEGLSGPELGQVLGIPEGTVRSRLARARELLRERMAVLDGNGRRG